MSNYSEGQTHQLMEALQNAGYTPEHVTMLGQYPKLGDFRLVLSGEAEIIPQPKPEPLPEPVLDFLVRVDRSVKPSYPDWFKKLEHPELECSGPAEYDLQTAVQQWLHDDQKRGSAAGNIIYKHLQKGDNLATCLNLQDGFAIQAKGIAVFRKLFAGKSVFLWGSVVQGRNGRLLVPCLYENGVEVVVYWRWLDVGWCSSDPALRGK